MTTYVLRPFTTISSANVSTLGVSSAMDDDNDATGRFVLDFGHLILGMDDASIPSDETVVQCRVRVRYGTGNGNTDMNVRLRDSAGNVSASDYYNANLSSTVVTVEGGWRTTAPDGGAWTPAKVNDLQVYITEGDGTTSPGIREVYLDVLTNEIPAVAASSPTGTISDTMQPTVEATYSDTESDAMDAYQIKVFSAAQYGAGGFDPATSTATWDSGTVLSSNPSISKMVSSPLPNSTTYRAYVRARQSTTISQWSDWDYVEFDIDVVPPNDPIFAVTGDSTNSRVQIDLEGDGPALVSGYRQFEVERSADGGTTWEAVSSAWPSDLDEYTYTDPNQAATVYDYAAERGVPVTYRARVKSVLASGAIVVSDWVEDGPVTISADRWWLKCLRDPGLSMKLHFHGERLVLTSVERGGVFRPIGRSKAVVVSDVEGSEEGVLELAFLTPERYSAFETLRRLRETLLLQSPYGDHLYIRFVGSRVAGFTLGPPYVPKRVVTVPFVEVEAP